MTSHECPKCKRIWRCNFSWCTAKAPVRCPKCSGVDPWFKKYVVESEKFVYGMSDEV